MAKLMRGTLLAAAFVAGASVAWAKLPPPPPPDDKAKDAAAAEKAKAAQTAAEERAVKNYQANMKKAGKPIPKPTPVVAPVPAAPAKPADKGAAPAKPPESAKKT